MDDCTLYILTVNPAVLLTEFLEGKIAKEPKLGDVAYLPISQVKAGDWGVYSDLVTGFHCEGLAAFKLSLVRELHLASLCHSLIDRFTHIRILHIQSSGVVADQRYEVSTFIDQYHPFYSSPHIESGPIQIRENEAPEAGEWGDEQDVL